MTSVSRSSGATLLVALSVVALSCTAASAEPADTALRWNEIAQQTVAPVNAYIQSRSMAITQLAVLEAVTRSVGSKAVAKADTASPDAAVMAAAHAALLALRPDSAAALDAALDAELAKLEDGEPKTNGIAVGKAAAGDILARRKTDGWDAKVEYKLAGSPGIWVPTPPNSAPALVPHWGKVTPFALKTSDQFRPGAPSSLDSARYLDDLREVLEMGAATSSKRPPEMTEAAKFWTISAVQGWNPAARQVSLANKRNLADNAHTLALLNVAMADALIACFDAKYTYNSWRPVTAIRTGVGDIKPVADWLPLIVTPPFPAYPSGHACAAGAAQEVLEHRFGPDRHAITLTSAAAPGVVFEYVSFKAIADQIDDARVYGGIHIREDQTAGRTLGKEVGRYVYETLAQAVP
ncbi:MAG TPA: vanadium-dependent haloperoxidase [Azospirillum sp.]|nr:vanadium-dependent haloperoxidase [Azospirillum sp.]